MTVTHDGLKGSDLHRPSRWPILNNTGSQLNVGQWVALDVDENSDDIVPVIALAATDAINIGLVTDVNIANGVTGTVLTEGRLRADTSSFSQDQGIRIVNTAGVFTFVVSTDSTHEIGRVLTVGSNGTIIIDTLSIAIAPITPGAKDLNDLTDVDTASVQSGDILVADGSTPPIFKNQQPTANNTITQLESNGTRIGDNTLNKFNFSTNFSVALDGSDSTTGDIDLSSTLSTTISENDTRSKANETKVDSLVDGTTGKLRNIGNTNFTNLKNNQIPEYRLESDTWINVDVPTGSARRLEDLTDVNITDQTDGKFIVSRAGSAYFQVNPASIGDTIYNVDTTGGLMFTKPSGSTPLINSVAVAFALNRSGNTTSYLIVDETGGDQLLVEMSFTASSITVEQFIDRIVLALETNWSDGTGTSTERTVNDQMAGSTLIGMNGTWSKAENPNFVRGEKAVGTTNDYFMPEGHPPINDAQAISWNISGRPNGYLQGKTAAFTGLGDMPTVVELLDAGVSGLNAHSNFNPHYIASRVGNGIRVTALADGSQDNGRLVVEFIDDAMGPSNAAGYIQSEGITNLTGGVNGVGQEFSFRWTDSAHTHKIISPTLETGGSATTTFLQGGFSWIDEIPTLNALGDVNINLPDPGNNQLQMLRSDFFGNFNNIDARIENLNVSSISASLKQGTLLQYAPAGVGEWIHTGLRDDGSGNFTETPNAGQFLVFFDSGGTSSGWEAKDAALNDLDDVDTVTTAPVEGDTLRFNGTTWTPLRQDIPQGTFFTEIGNNNVTGGLGTKANLPFFNTKSDPISYTAVSTGITINMDGVYKFQAGISKSITDTDNSNLMVTTLIRVLKNNVLIATNEYAGNDNNILDATFTMREELEFVQDSIQTVQFERSREDISLDLVSGDVISVELEYATAGLIGLNMTDGEFGNSWLRCERIG